MATRRFFLQVSALAAGSTMLPRFSSRAFAQSIPGGTLPPEGIPKYVTNLVIPPAMPRTTRLPSGMAKRIDYYEIAVRQLQQQILPPGFAPTTVWGYGSANHPGTFNYPSFTIEARNNTPVRVKWINQLVDGNGDFLPHLLAVDPTLHWANPPGGNTNRDSRPIFNGTPGPYTGPVPLVTHVHGAHANEEFDGYAEAWYLPNAGNIPQDYAVVGSRYDQFKAKAEALLGQLWTPGSSVFQYANDQRASTLWYHDHTLGMTRLNVYAGPAGFYILRGGTQEAATGILPGPSPQLGDLPGTKYFEIPIAIQDRSFNLDGGLFFPGSRTFFDGFEGPYIGDQDSGSDISPIWNPEFFGNAMVVNGRTWPVLNVEPRRYRFRLLNGCNSRFLILKMVLGDPAAARPVPADLPFWQIGTEGGYLPAPVQLPQLLMGLAERADVIVDFTPFAGKEIFMINEGPDEPFGGGIGNPDFPYADPATTGQVMKFVVGRKVSSPDKTANPAQGGLILPPFTPIGAHTNVRQVSLNEADSGVLPGVGPREAILGTMDELGMPMPMMWMEPITETPQLGATEIWEIYNFTADAHPIHLHLVQFQVVNRQNLATDSEGMSMAPAELSGPPIPPEPWETGYKDTVIAYPGQVTRIKATFDKKGLYVWHCHIVDHEDNEMMRPYEVI